MGQTGGRTDGQITLLLYSTLSPQHSQNTGGGVFEHVYIIAYSREEFREYGLGGGSGVHSFFDD